MRVNICMCACVLVAYIGMRANMRVYIHVCGCVCISGCNHVTGVAWGGGQFPIFCQPKKFKSLKITTHKSVYSNKDEIDF